jgi:hypothetical protein
MAPTKPRNHHHEHKSNKMAPTKPIHNRKQVVIPSGRARTRGEQDGMKKKGDIRGWIALPRGRPPATKKRTKTAMTVDDEDEEQALDEQALDLLQTMQKKPLVHPKKRSRSILIMMTQL